MRVARRPHLATVRRAFDTLVSGNSDRMRRQIGVEDMTTTVSVRGGWADTGVAGGAIATDIELCCSAVHPVEVFAHPDLVDRTAWSRPGRVDAS
jgi:hypothetical protein